MKSRLSRLTCTDAGRRGRAVHGDRLFRDVPPVTMPHTTQEAGR